MPLQIVPMHRKESLQDDGMLFVRTESILDTMVKTSLIVASLIVVALMMPQASFSSTRTLDLTLYSDGSAHISTQIDVDPLEPDFETHLFGSSIDNFVSVSENGFLLSNEVINDKVTIDTFGSSSITIDYDTHDLISKEGRIWTFSINSPTDYSLLMPFNSIIVGMNAIPTNIIIENEQTKLELGSGTSAVDYIFGTTNAPTITPEQTIDTLPLVLAGGGAVAAVIAGVMIVKKKRQRQSASALKIISNSKPSDGPLDIETIFKMRPEMREDDKDIVKFISEKGGKLLESDLRKKFLQPKTTMWRAVKRLERQGVVEITKKDLQNIVKLKELEEKD